MGIGYRHPTKGEPLAIGRDGHLYEPGGQLAFANSDGSYDFVTDESSRQERAFYDTTYAEGGWWASNESLDAVDYQALWSVEPWSIDYLKSLGDLANKKVLLIGNGTSIKEVLFVKLGANVTFTDLSFKAVEYAKHRYRASELGGTKPAECEFHAVDAYYLPFDSDTFDVICADAVIHHMEDLKGLFLGIHRCLKPGGMCRFADTAYSSMWQGAKKTFLRPLQKYTHRKLGISPEDQKATERGGYQLQEIERLRKELGFKSVYYQRVAFFDYLLWRASFKLGVGWVLAVRPAARWFDRVLAKTRFMQSQGIALVFGFNK